MRFIAEDNPNLYIDVENYSELEEKIKDFEKNNQQHKHRPAANCSQPQGRLEDSRQGTYARWLNGPYRAVDILQGRSRVPARDGIRRHQENRIHSLPAYRRL